MNLKRQQMNSSRTKCLLENMKNKSNQKTSKRLRMGAFASNILIKIKFIKYRYIILKIYPEV